MFICTRSENLWRGIHQTKPFYESFIIIHPALESVEFKPPVFISPLSNQNKEEATLLSQHSFFGMMVPVWHLHCYGEDIRCIRMLGFLASETWFQTHFQFFLLKRAFLQTMYLGCVSKWIWSQERNSVPESRRASLYSVKVIKMSRLTINRILTLWSLHGSLRCCKTDCTTFLSLNTQDAERRQFDVAKTAPKTLAFFNCAYLFACSHLKFDCLHLTESTQMHLLK